MVPLPGGAELVILLLVGLLLVGVPLLLVVLVVFPFVKGYIGEDGDGTASADPDDLAALRERVDELETEVERLRESGPDSRDGSR